MASEVSMKIPKIDFSSSPDLQPGTDHWDQLRSQVLQALKSFGCFEAVYPKVSQETRQAFFSVLEDLFSLPVETKLLNTSEVPTFGYVGHYPHLPLYESLGISQASLPDNVLKFSNLMWPHGNLNFREVVSLLVGQISDLEKMVRRMVMEELGVEKYYESNNESIDYLLRMMKYKGPEKEGVQEGLGSHTDMTMLSILFQNQVSGLQIQTKDGEWIPVEISPDSFTVMAGDSFLAWSNGRLHAPWHRVMMEGNEARYSVAVFALPKGGHLVQAPEEMVGEEHPLLFKPFDVIEYLNYISSEGGKPGKSALKDYCGV
ncbi:Iron/ascorbate family oxidoreductases protein [Dioscorea alata]|uniref:Iron/ascorbate family oxidoreductases protein n=1 Tax=Dioscorea alata TaxID=55571 RepID=A0ACB7U730_DIOAL|nr:Iron/ascorbate family oxidoreductases protein [Dioscorea alata]